MQPTLPSRHADRYPSWLIRRLGFLSDEEVTTLDAHKPLRRDVSPEIAALFRDLAGEAVDRVISQRLSLHEPDKAYLVRQLVKSCLYGKGVSELTHHLKRLGLGDETAEIAFDLSFKLFALAEQTVMRNIGVTHFTWIVTGNRCGHARHNGKKFPLNTETARGLPGQRMNCTCIASPAWGYK